MIKLEGGLELNPALIESVDYDLRKVIIRMSSGRVISRYLADEDGKVLNAALDQLSDKCPR